MIIGTESTLNPGSTTILFKSPVIILSHLVFSTCKKEIPVGWIDQDRLMNREAKDWLSVGSNMNATTLFSA
jgi:hypothetical protein